MTPRIFKYKIPESFVGHKISEFLKSVHFSEKILAMLRQDDTSLKFNDCTVYMNKLISSSGLLLVYIKPDEKSDKVLPVKTPIDILYEDEDLMVINKPANMPVHPSRQNLEYTLGNAVAYHYEENGENHLFRCINRLDKDTSGLTIIAKNRVIAAMFYDQIQRREIYREYTAIVEGELSGTGTIDKPIGKTNNQGSIMRCIDYNGQSAITHYKSTPLSDSLSLVKLHLDTGRTHQIRVHMKEIGHPLIGDRLYNPANNQMKRQALHAGILKFKHPYTGEELCFSQELPQDMQDFLCGLHN